MARRAALLIAVCVGLAASLSDAQASDPCSGGPSGPPCPSILLSRQLAAQEHIRVGDTITLAADSTGTLSRQFRVAGIYEPTPDPRKFPARRLEARLHLPDLMALTGDPEEPLSAESVTAVNVALADARDGSAVTSALTTRVPGLIVQSTATPARGSDPFAVLDRFHWAIAIVTVAGSTAFLLALMVMRAEERREVIGVLRLIGIPTKSILGEVLFEGLLIAAAGAVFGILVAVSAQSLVNRFFQWRYDTTLVFVRVTGGIAWQSMAFAVPLGVLAGLGASWTLLRRHVVALIGR